MLADVEFGKRFQIGIGKSPHQRDVIVHRAFWRPGRARGIDENGNILRPHGRRPFVEESLPVRHFRQARAAEPKNFGEADQPLVGILKHCPHIVDDDLANSRYAACRIQQLVDKFLIFRAEEIGVAVFELVFDFADRAGRVDAVTDRTAAQRGHVGDQEFPARIGHGGDSVAGPQPERFKAGEKFRHQAPVVAPRHVLINALILVTKCDPFRRRRAAGDEPLWNAPGVEFRSPQLVITVHVTPRTVTSR